MGTSLFNLSHYDYNETCYFPANNFLLKVFRLFFMEILICFACFSTDIKRNVFYEQINRTPKRLVNTLGKTNLEWLQFICQVKLLKC